jgi:transcriptional regulator with XRE-family HTH domain
MTQKPVLRQFIGEVLRKRRLASGLTLRDVSAKARVSLGYISEVERGHKEPSSELLSALTTALDVPLSQMLLDVSALVAAEEATAQLAWGTVSSIAPDVSGVPGSNAHVSAA